jgi:hypothetical protein
MKKYFSHLVLICLLLVNSNITKAQSDYDSAVVTVDTTISSSAENDEEKANETVNEYKRLHMSESKLESLRKKKEFKYPDLENDTLQIKQEPPPVTKFEPFDASIFLWLLIAVAAVIVVLQISGLNFRQLFSPARITLKLNAEDISENIDEIPFESAIANAIKTADYSLATRLMYLQGLKKLSDKKLIEWHENKTNWQYVYELKSIPLRSSFRSITSIFEYVQYGNMKVDESRFVLVQEAFKNFQTNIG